MGLVLPVHISCRVGAAERWSVNQRDLKIWTPAESGEDAADPAKSNGNDKYGYSDNPLVVIKPSAYLWVELGECGKHLKPELSRAAKRRWLQ